ncbi:MAG: GtrA family protein [Rhizobiales bacterium]|nr:GtrA family protein [Hyphomicrobiales bacterium]
MVKAIRFGMIGALSGAAFLGVTMVLVDLIGVGAKLAAAIAYLSSMPLNFIGNRRFSFRSRGSLVPDLSRFAVLHAVNLLLAMLSMGAVVDLLGIHYLLGAAATIVIVPLVNFAAMNWWVFRARRCDRSDATRCGGEGKA